MACNTCEVGCVPISADCFCQYSTLNGIDPYNNIPVVNEVNSILEGLIGEECVENLCDEKYSESINSHKFKRFWVKLFDIEWLQRNGSGQVSKEGIVRKQGDEYSDYQVVSYSEVERRVKAMRSSLERFEAAWLKEFKAAHPECDTCEDAKLSCGCVAVCGCKNNPSPKQIKKSQCGGGCNSCGCSDNNVLLDFEPI